MLYIQHLLSIVRISRCSSTIWNVFISYVELVHPTDNERDLLIPAIQGTENMLDAAKSQSTVKHLVVTSSAGSHFDID